MTEDFAGKLHVSPLMVMVESTCQGWIKVHMHNIF